MASLQLNTHEEGCTPLKPCMHCTALNFLQRNLGRDSLAEFLAILGEDLPMGTTAQLDPSSPIAKLGLDQIKQNGMAIRIRTVLERNQIQTLGDLLKKTKRSLLEMDNFGERCLQELESLVEKAGYKLNE